MSKFLAVVKREYMARIRTKMFVLGTVLGPLLMIAFTIVPAFILSIKAGEATRLAVVDQTGRMYERVREAVLSAQDRGIEGGDAVAEEQAHSTSAAVKQEAQYRIERVSLNNRSLEEAKRELSERVRKGQLDAYIILSPDILAGGAAELYGRNVGDVIAKRQLTDCLSRAVVEQRMTDANVDQNMVREMSKRVQLSTIKISDSGEEKDTGGGFTLALTVGLLIYFTLAVYGQVILSAVVEEKETRIAEVLFSSVRAFPLLMGKLVGISMVALTQYAIWALAFLLFTLYGVGLFAARGMEVALPKVPLSVAAYFFVFFLLGYFVYATIYALVGSMVTTAQEGGQVALPVIFLLMIAIYLAFPVIRSPNSSFAFWVSMVPFFSPITMLVRIVTQTPPLWEIALSLLIGVGTSVVLIWIAARIYRVGMLMYGKRASVPEVIRWVRQT